MEPSADFTHPLESLYVHSAYHVPEPVMTGG